jgi:Dockerin type I domain
MKCILRLQIVAKLILATLAISERPANAQGVCPPVGEDTNCGVIITITDSGASVSRTGQGPFDGDDDTLVGVVNNSRLPVLSLGVKSALTIFGFEDDGLVSFGIQGNPKDSTGYGGPNAYFVNINPSLTAGTVNFIVPIAARGGIAYFALEDDITSATACTTLLNNALKVVVPKREVINASFTPNPGQPSQPQPTLSQAAAICGFFDFDWQQTITSWPLPSPIHQVGITMPVSAPPAFLDPPKGGYTYELTDTDDHGNLLYPDGDNSFPFYYDPISGELQNQKNANDDTLFFYDDPADDCLPGGDGSECSGKTAPTGSKLAFITHLVGVNFDQTATDLGVGFKWTSTYNGKSGGVSRTKNSHPPDPGSGTGGVTITSVQEFTTYQAIAITTVNGTLIGDVNGNGVVDCADLAIVKASFGKTAGQAGFDPRADLNKDGVVSVLDLSIVAKQLPAGTTCP